ncbi:MULTISPECIES: sigma-70 family RNA polymerase sigma factor [Caldimonas]|uniref:RNA polymerase sigma factor n=1 Tax=Caldimonas TaxID=196013 RepID=UPI00036FDA9E|nr:sigma-70 family RNA polymerase sigma factor [Caldimonas manganoxidans]
MPERDGSALTDEQLLAAVARGDHAALRELHRRHAAAAVRFAWRMLNDVAEAEEAVADAFCDVWQQAHRFGGASRVRTWMLGIVRHKALDRLRRRHSSPTVSLEDEGPDAQNLGIAADPEDLAMRRQDVERLLACFEKLNPDQREALYLAVVEGLTVAEIACIQAVAPGTVATRIHHGRRKLRECAQGE